MGQHPPQTAARTRRRMRGPWTRPSGATLTRLRTHPRMRNARARRVPPLAAKEGSAPYPDIFAAALRDPGEACAWRPARSAAPAGSSKRIATTRATVWAGKSAVWLERTDLSRALRGSLVAKRRPCLPLHPADLRLRRSICAPATGTARRSRARVGQPAAKALEVGPRARSGCKRPRIRRMEAPCIGWFAKAYYRVTSTNDFPGTAISVVGTPSPGAGFGSANRRSFVGAVVPLGRLTRGVRAVSPRFTKSKRTLPTASREASSAPLPPSSQIGPPWPVRRPACAEDVVRQLSVRPGRPWSSFTLRSAALEGSTLCPRGGYVGSTA